jgi:hypothetical protein
MAARASRAERSQGSVMAGSGYRGLGVRDRLKLNRLPIPETSNLLSA